VATFVQSRSHVFIRLKVVGEPGFVLMGREEINSPAGSSMPLLLVIYLRLQTFSELNGSIGKNLPSVV
jgi:hypothetical protein